MSKNMVLIVAVAAVALGAACESATVSNSNTTSNTNAIVNVDPANLPEGLSTEPIQPSANSTPGIAVASPSKVPSNVSPAEGIPSAEDLRKPAKPGATPTPGIPDPETLKKQMTTPANVSSGAKNPTAPNGSNPGSSAAREQRPNKP